MSDTINCDYCHKPALLLMGDKVYPNLPNLAMKYFWVCNDCDARVGCHPDTVVPLGRMANRKLRRLRTLAHEAFDPLWRSKAMTRSDAYNWLSGAMKMDPQKCHVGMFNEEQCELAAQLCALKRMELNI